MHIRIYNVMFTCTYVLFYYLVVTVSFSKSSYTISKYTISKSVTIVLSDSLSDDFAIQVVDNQGSAISKLNYIINFYYDSIIL